MRFVFKKKVLSSIMAATMAAGFAASQNAAAIHLSEDGIGQVLLAPYYTVLNGYQTKVSIFNTRSDVAVKVKVVIRSQGHSQEGRDFICYMTPADVCRFEIVNQNGQAYVTSTDDSVRNTSGGFASQSPPLNIIVDDTKMKQVDANDINEIGHIELIGVYAVKTGTYTTGAGETVVVRREMSKVDLAKIFDASRYTDTGAVNNVVTYSKGTAQYTAVDTPAAFGLVSNDPSWLRISGEVLITKQNGSQTVDRMAYRIPALAGSMTSAGKDDPLDPRVIASPTFDASISAETPIGQAFGNSTVATGDNILAIEKALAASWLSSIYESTADTNEKTGIFITFPTKYLHRGSNPCGVAGFSSLVQYSSPFELNGTVNFGLNSYDNQERMKQEVNFFSPVISTATYLAGEVNYLQAGWFATGGFFDLNLLPKTGCGNQYSGVPVLGLTYKYIDSNGTPVNSMLIPTTHE